MSEVLECVDLVTSALRDGAELMARNMKKNKQQSGRRDQHETLLFDVLATAPGQIQQKYQMGRKQFGTAYQSGDETARSQLIIIALDINAEIVQALETANEEDSMPLNLVQLHEKAVTSRHDANRVLNELTERLSASWPFIPSSAGSSSSSSLNLTLPSRTNLFPPSHSPVSPLVELPITPFELPGVIPPRELPADVPVELPAVVPIELPGSTPEHVKALIEQVRVEKEMEKSRFRRLFSRGSTKSRTKAGNLSQSASSSTTVNSQPSLAKVAVQRSARAVSPNHKSCSQLNAKDNRSPALHDQPTSPAQVLSPISQHESIFSSLPMPSFGAARTPPAGLAIANGTPHMASYFADGRFLAELDDTSSIMTQDHDKESLFSKIDGTPGTPTTTYSSSPISPAMDLPSSTFPISPISEEDDEIDDYYLIATKSDSLYRKDSSASIGKAALGRPGKSNNYHNFCKGAWTCRSASPWAGLTLRTLTSATGTVVQQYQCKWCHFRSPPIGRSKSLPDKIHISAQGIAYRWLFLLRSHARCLDVKAGGNKNWPLPPDLPSMAGIGEYDGYEFGCLFCSVEGQETKVYKDVERLMAHVDARHAGALSDEVCKKTRCIEGRVAEKREAWDVNVCQFDV